MGKIFGLYIEDDKILQYICFSDIFIGLYGLIFAFLIIEESTLDDSRTSETFYAILIYILFRILLVIFSLFASFSRNSIDNKRLFKRVRTLQLSTSVITLLLLDVYVGKCLTNAYAKYSPNKQPSFFDIFKRLHNPNTQNEVNRIFNLSLGLLCLNFLELFLSVIATHLFFMYKNNQSEQENLKANENEIKSVFVSKRDQNSLRKINLPNQLIFQRIQMKSLEIELTWGVPAHVIYKLLLSEL